MSAPITFDQYVESLSQLDLPFDPTVPTAESTVIRDGVEELEKLTTVDVASLSVLVSENPDLVPILGLTVGLSREKLKNVLKHHLGSAAWVKAARQDARPIVEMLDREYDLVRLLKAQRGGTYDFADVLIARAGTRRTAAAAGQSGLLVENEIEAVAKSLNLPYELRTRFVGRNGLDAPCDLAIPAGGSNAQIVVAAKGFDSTGSKLTAAVGEIEDMAERRLPTQFIMAVIDGIGWKNRLADLRRIYDLRDSDSIDGLYTLRGLDAFRDDLENAARLRGLL